MKSANGNSATPSGAYGCQATSPRAAERKRHRDADDAGDQRHPANRLQRLDLEPPADQEHEQRDTDLPEHAQCGQRCGREEQRRHARCNPAKQRGTEHEPGDHLRDDRRLAQPSRDGRGQARQGEDDGDLTSQKQRGGHGWNSLLRY